MEFRGGVIWTGKEGTDSEAGALRNSLNYFVFGFY